MKVLELRSALFDLAYKMMRAIELDDLAIAVQVKALEND